MNEDQARRFLHDNVYSPMFRKKFAEYTGIQFENAEEEAHVQALAYRLKQAAARRHAQALPQQRLRKQALYAKMDRLASNGLGEMPAEDQYRAQAILNQFGTALRDANL